MPRVRFEELPAGAAGGAEASFRKPPAPPGYTGNTVITECSRGARAPQPRAASLVRRP
jgi:hypothetical protein